MNALIVVEIGAMRRKNYNGYRWSVRIRICNRIPNIKFKSKKDDEKMFDYGFLYCYSKECEKGFKVKRVNNTISKGTKFTYTAIKDEHDFEEYKKILKQMISNFKYKYGTNIKAQ